MEFTTAEIARATGGEVFGREATVEGVAIDSRLVAPGQLFVPIVAERDGHDFISAALSAGAAGYLTSAAIEAGTAVRVADTSLALTAIGRHARTRLPDRVVGITGSVGKTSVKDLLAAVGATTWPTHASIGSFNNEMGVPLTLANAPNATELTVVEMGARGQGHIATLCSVAHPTVGIVTLVAGAHLEQFGTLDGVARAKSELVMSLPAAGTAVLNADDHRVVAMAAVTDASIVTFGLGAADVTAENVTLGDDLRAQFALRSPWGSAAVHLGVAGQHQVTNALAAAAAALAMGADVEAVAAGLGAAHLSAGRMDLLSGPSGVRVINDTYNANTTSMIAALQALAAIKVGQRVAVIGTMAELGADADAAHREVVAEALRLGIAVVAVNEPRYDAEVVTHVADPEGAVQALTGFGLGRGTDIAVLVKASRSARLERVVALLMD